MVFHWSLSDSKSPQISRTLLSILPVLNSTVVWMVSTRPQTSKSSSPFNNPLVTEPKAPITIGTIVTSMFHSFFLYPCKIEVLVLLFTFFQFYSVVSRDYYHYYYKCILLTLNCSFITASFVYSEKKFSPQIKFFSFYTSLLASTEYIFFLKEHF